MQISDQPYLMECPECGRNSLVKHSANVYQCLNCHFRRDLSDSLNSQSSLMFIVFLTIAILLAATARPAPPISPPASQPPQPFSSAIENP